MCEPITIAALATTAASGLAQTYASRQAASMQGTIARHNANLAEQAAQDALDRGDFDEWLLRERGHQFAGRQRAIIGASGIAVDEGAAALAIEDTYANIEMDARMIRNNAAREAWGLQAQATQFRFESDAAARQETVATAAGLLSTGAQFAGQWNTLGVGNTLASRKAIKVPKTPKAPKSGGSS